MNKRWHFKYVHANRMGTMWSDPVDSDQESRTAELRRCILHLRQIDGLSVTEILDATVQLVDDPGNN